MVFFPCVPWEAWQIWNFMRGTAHQFSFFQIKLAEKFFPVGSQLECVLGPQCPLLSNIAALSESAELLMWCWNLLLLDSYSWFWSGSSKEEVSISTAPNVLWRYIFMTTQLIALFVPSGVWLFNQPSHSCESPSDFTARLGFAKTRRMRLAKLN